MNTKMKESKNLKASNNNILVGIYLDKIKHEGQLSECIYALANQNYPVDVVVLDGGMSDREVEVLFNIAKKPTIKTVKTKEDGGIEEQILESKSPLNINIIEVGVCNFSKVFNEIFNIAVENDYESFSVVETQDSIGANWYSIANTYMQENSEIGIFLPMMRNFQNGSLSGLMNEACWAEGIAEEAGKFDMNLLLRYNCANPLGGVYRVDKIQEFSEEKDGKFYPMKESFKLSHYYEFFLRMIYNDVKMMTVPRVGYDFVVLNSDEYNHSSSKVPANITTLPTEKGGLSVQEASFWMENAKKEYFFDEDRCKTFSETV